MEKATGVAADGCSDAQKWLESYLLDTPHPLAGLYKITFDYGIREGDEWERKQATAYAAVQGGWGSVNKLTAILRKQLNEYHGNPDCGIPDEGIYLVSLRSVERIAEDCLFVAAPPKIK